MVILKEPNHKNGSLLGLTQFLDYMCIRKVIFSETGGSKIKKQQH